MLDLNEARSLHDSSWGAEQEKKRVAQPEKKRGFIREEFDRQIQQRDTLMRSIEDIEKSLRRLPMTLQEMKMQDENRELLPLLNKRLFRLMESIQHLAEQMEAGAVNVPRPRKGYEAVPRIADKDVTSLDDQEYNQTFLDAEDVSERQFDDDLGQVTRPPRPRI